MNGDEHACPDRKKPQKWNGRTRQRLRRASDFNGNALRPRCVFQRRRNAPRQAKNLAKVENPNVTGIQMTRAKMDSPLPASPNSPGAAVLAVAPATPSWQNAPLPGLTVPPRRPVMGASNVLRQTHFTNNALPCIGPQHRTGARGGQPRHGIWTHPFMSGLKISQRRLSSAGRWFARAATPFKHVRQAAFQPLKKVFQHFQSDVLFSHFHALKR